MNTATVLTAAALLAIASMSASCSEPAPAATPEPQTAEAGAQAITAQDPVILAASQTTPEAFVRALYDVYDVSPLEDRRDNQTFYSVRTQALIAKAIAENGYFDVDPILMAQDYEAVSVTSATVTPSGPDQAAVSVVVRNMGADSRAEFLLVKEADGWRIDDVKTTDMASLIAHLEAG